MEIIPIEYCDICDSYIHLNQKLADCAFEHKCESNETDCPFKRFFTKQNNKTADPIIQSNEDMPQFYISDL